MGTGLSGNYINSYGASAGVGLPSWGILTHNIQPAHITNKALNHSNIGDFTHPFKPSVAPRLIGGGHGQDGINKLKELGIKYNIVKTWKNGVRLGNITSHKDKKKELEQISHGSQRAGQKKT